MNFDWDKYLKKDGDLLRRNFGLPQILQTNFEGTKSPSIQCEHLLLNDNKQIQSPSIFFYQIKKIL